jgi:hypothetical protein
LDRSRVNSVGSGNLADNKGLGQGASSSLSQISMRSASWLTDRNGAGHRCPDRFQFSDRMTGNAACRRPPDPRRAGRQHTRAGRQQVATSRRAARVPGADLHRPASIADDAARTIVDRPGGPIASWLVNRRRVAVVDNIARRPRGDDGAGDDGAADDASGNTWPPSPSSLPPSGGVRRSPGQHHYDRCSAE